MTVTDFSKDHPERTRGYRGRADRFWDIVLDAYRSVAARIG